MTEPIATPQIRDPLAVTVGALARTVGNLKEQNTSLTARVKALEDDAERVRTFISEYEPLVKKFLNGPGKLLLKG